MASRGLIEQLLKEDMSSRGYEEKMHESRVIVDKDDISDLATVYQ